MNGFKCLNLGRIKEKEQKKEQKLQKHEERVRQKEERERQKEEREASIAINKLPRWPTLKQIVMDDKGKVEQFTLLKQQFSTICDRLGP